MYREIESSEFLAVPPAGGSGLTGYWRLSEGTGTAVSDATGNGNNGTLSGGTWQVGMIADDYNEAEGAYTLTADTLGGAYFDLDGGTYTRHDPVFKMRGYQRTTDPDAIKLEGATQSDGTNYNLDVKPVSYAQFAAEETWASTMESSGAVTSPDIGSAGTVTNATFTTGSIFLFL